MSETCQGCEHKRFVESVGAALCHHAQAPYHSSIAVTDDGEIPAWCPVPYAARCGDRFARRVEMDRHDQYCASCDFFPEEARPGARKESA